MRATPNPPRVHRSRQLLSHAGSHDAVEADLGRDAVANLLHGVFRQGSRSRSSRGIRPGLTDVVRRAVPRCTAQASTTWAGVLPRRRAISVITGSSSSSGLHRLPQRRKRQQHDPLPLDNSRAGPIPGDRGWDRPPTTAGFDLVLLRRPPCSFARLTFRQADRAAPALVHQALQRLPCLDQCHAGIVDDLGRARPAAPARRPGWKAKGVWMR